MQELKLFSIYDTKALAYLPPFFLPQRGQAMRTFETAAMINPTPSAPIQKITPCSTWVLLTTLLLALYLSQLHTPLEKDRNSSENPKSIKAYLISKPQKSTINLNLPARQ